jgi:hypothetical protein
VNSSIFGTVGWKTLLVFQALHQMGVTEEVIFGAVNRVFQRAPEFQIANPRILNPDARYGRQGGTAKNLSSSQETCRLGKNTRVFHIAPVAFAKTRGSQASQNVNRQ